MITSPIFLVIAVSCVEGFTAILPSPFVTKHTNLMKNSVALQNDMLNDIDTMCVTNQAAYCTEETNEDECDLDQVDALISQLQDQRKFQKDRLQTLRRNNASNDDNNIDKREIVSLMLDIRKAKGRFNAKNNYVDPYIQG